MANTKQTTEEPLEKQLWKAADKLRKNIDAAEIVKQVSALCCAYKSKKDRLRNLLWWFERADCVELGE